VSDDLGDERSDKGVQMTLWVFILHPDSPKAYDRSAGGRKKYWHGRMAQANWQDSGKEGSSLD
jgi:hypothetical protein